MRLTPESATLTMTRDELTKRLNLKDDAKSEEELRELLIQSERSRCLCMWHDHATILKMGFIMVTVHIMYDPVVFYTDKEYEELNPGATVNVQSQVEQPEIHLLAAGSDQAALIGDRLKCLKPVKTEMGTKITDTLRFFTGDHPATQFEQGTKQGGTYKCGMCGCQEHLFNDQAHAGGHYIIYKPCLQQEDLGGMLGHSDPLTSK